MAKTTSFSDVKDPVVRRMLDNFKLSADTEADNRKKAIFAQKFRQGGDAQWDAQQLTMRQDGKRPTESYNQVPQFLHQVTNDMRMNMPQTRFVPGADGKIEVAEVYEDLARNIQSSSEGEVAYDAAADSQVTIGWGYWRYLTEYESDKTFDQIIKIGWIPNPLMIYDDVNCIQQDFSDRTYLIHVFDMVKDDFNNQYNQDYDSQVLESIGDSQPDWATDNTVRVAEYWEMTQVKSKLYRQNGKITNTKPKGEAYEERDVLVPKVKWYKCTARDKLDEKEWPGVYIPYVRVSGEMQIIDGKTYYTGLVEGMISPQKMYNNWSNTASEIMGLAPISPWIMAAGQQEGFETMWANANIRKTPYLLYNPTNNIAGQPLPPPQRNNASADVNGALSLIQQAQQNFYTTTGIYPASLGQQSNEKSGKAILARQKEGDVSTFHYSDNIARALRFGGRILADLFPKIYDGTRIIKLTKEDKTTREIKINAPFKNKKGETENIDMTAGTYDVMVTTGPSFTTKRAESSEFYQQLAQSYPPLMQLAGDLVVGTSDAAGADKIAERLKSALPPNLVEDDENPLPPQITAQMQQMQQVIEQQGQQLQQAQQAIADKQADIQNKQADLKLKGQQMQLDAEDAERQSQIDMAKIALDREKLQVEVLKVEIGTSEGQVNNNSVSKAPDSAQTPEDDENVLFAKVQSLRDKRQKEAMNAEMMQNMALQEQHDKMQQAALDAQNSAQQAQTTQATLDRLDTLSSAIANLVIESNKPKSVNIMRGPDGFAQGAVIAPIDTVGNA